ncbi:DUF262 domain-containing protein [Winogradskyella pacifica]|uniref:DUF262 domain-containing protein n=1 Tax=Winogradskyella pacifica TaxID=664642 RepID=UPI0015C8AA97|nr:DUF262 domain-containing protein [Winogradskyella pacifica]
MKHIEKAESKHLDKIISDIRDGKYVIPDFQREFEWNPWDVNGLIASIFMDYYIGTLLLWKASEKNVKVLSCEGIKGFNGTLKPEHIVLDGQQRLTAMYFAFFNPDIVYPKRKSRCYFFMNIKFLVEENYEEAFYYKWEGKWYNDFLESPEQQYEHNVFPLQVIGKGTWEMMDWLKGYENYWKTQQELNTTTDTSELNEDEKQSHKNRTLLIKESLGFVPEITKVLRELLSDYNLSYIELDREISVAKVCDIFTHINSKGVALNIFDLLNAILRPYDIYLKDMWRNVSEELSYTDQDKMKIYVFQVMSILEQTYCSSKYLYYLVPDTVKTTKENGSKKKVVLIKSKEEFETKWNSAVEALKKTIYTLKNPRDFGAINSTFVPYPSIIPAFTAIKKHVEQKGYKNILDVNAKIKKWYWSSIFTLNYSSSVESTSAKDFIDMKKWFDDDTQEPENYIKFIQDLENQSFQKQNSKGSAIYNAIFNILILNEARDWYTSELPEYETLDDHHIVPHSWGKKNIGNDINSILNKTPLSPTTNRHIINSRLPNEYLAEMLENNGSEKFYKILESHLISKKSADILMRKPFTKEDYYEFIAEREKSVKSYIKSSIIDDFRELPIELRVINDQIEELELKIRDVIASKINGQYKEFIAGHVQDKVSRRIENTLKKNPSLSLEHFSSTRKKLDYFDLQEYCDVITAKQTWEFFEPMFKNKSQVMEKFSKLGELRNGIRHSREVGEVALLEGKASIIWFNSLI